MQIPHVCKVLAINTKSVNLQLNLDKLVRNLRDRILKFLTNISSELGTQAANCGVKS